MKQTKKLKKKQKPTNQPTKKTLSLVSETKSHCVVEEEKYPGFNSKSRESCEREAHALDPGF
jgi:hypothetical protein